MLFFNVILKTITVYMIRRLMFEIERFIVKYLKLFELLIMNHVVKFQILNVKKPINIIMKSRYIF